jgi:hypothetical protein
MLRFFEVFEVTFLKLFSAKVFARKNVAAVAASEMGWNVDRGIPVY